MTYETQVNNLDFIENTYNYAKGLNTGIDLDAWRINVYKTYLRQEFRGIVEKKERVDRLLVHVKNDKKISLNLFIQRPN